MRNKRAIEVGPVKTGKRFSCCVDDLLEAGRMDVDIEREVILNQCWEGGERLEITLAPGQSLELTTPEKYDRGPMCRVAGPGSEPSEEIKKFQRLGGFDGAKRCAKRCGAGKVFVGRTIKSAVYRCEACGGYVIKRGWFETGSGLGGRRIDRDKCRA